jgi:PAS domain S-box-containing protein
MTKDPFDFSKYLSDITLVSVDRKSFIINAVWPRKSKLLGMGAKHCIGKKVTSFFSPSFREEFKTVAAIKKNGSGKKTLTLRIAGKNKNPTWLSCTIWKSPAHDGNKTLLLVLRNITLYKKNGQSTDTLDHDPEGTDPGGQVHEAREYKEHEFEDIIPIGDLVSGQKINKEEKSFSRIIERIPIAIAVNEITPPKRFVFINAGFTSLTGYTLEDIPDMGHWQNLAFGKDAPQMETRWYDQYKKIQHGEIRESAPLEFEIRRKDETIKQVEARFTVDNNLFYTIYRDITGNEKAPTGVTEEEPQGDAR